MIDTVKTTPDEDPFALKSAEELRTALGQQTHVFRSGHICKTDARGYPTRHNEDRWKIVVDASEGFIPLWAEGVTLRWRFQRRSIVKFARPENTMSAIESLMGEALLEWGDAAPVKFKKSDDVWDFEIAVMDSDECNISGCVLASAFFPDSGRHELVIYPKMFDQSKEEQIETLAHEFGHVFGLRHFFAEISETQWPSEIFGQHKRFTIMNYGEDSRLTDTDKSDLRSLYSAAWQGRLTKINNTPIKLVQPFHMTGTTRPAFIIETA